MSLLHYFALVLIISTYVSCDDTNNELDIESLAKQTNKGDLDLTSAKTNGEKKDEKVDVYVYYETLCPYSVNFFIYNILPILPTMHNYIRFHLYPYGNAETKVKDGNYVITCQHGEEECYGNKLHACALDLVTNEVEAVFFTCCLMAGISEDSTAVKCGRRMNIDGEAIIQCAKGDKGSRLLKYYGDLSGLIDYSEVPYIRVNSARSYPSTFKADICRALSNSPLPCKEPEYDVTK